MKSNPLRCHAKSKRSGKQCRSWAVRGKKVCRMHGAFAGNKTAQGRLKQAAAVTKHGVHTKAAIAERKAVRELIRDSKNMLRQVT